MAGLKEVSLQAGVSIRTVARALKGEGYVDPHTRSRVLAAAQQLGYRPNLLARSLRTRTSYEICVVAWSLDELHMGKIAGLEDRLRQEQYFVTITFISHPARSARPAKAGAQATPARGALDEVLQRRPAAVVLFADSGNPLAPEVRRLAAEGIPCVAFDSYEPGVDSVRIDRPAGIRQAICHLAQAGRRRIAYLGTRADRNRLEGYHAALRQLERQPLYLEVQPEPSGCQFRMGRLAAGLWRASKNPPDAVQAYSDLMALGFMAGLHDQAVRIPEEVAVVGFDGRAAAAYSWPRLTTVVQPSWQVGQAAAEILLRKIAGEPPPAGGWSCALPTHLSVGEST